MTIASTSIRPYVPIDEERVLAIAQLAYPDMPPPTPGRLNHMLTVFAEERIAADVAESAGQIVGQVLAGHLEAADPGAYFLELFVDPEKQGQGVGRMLYDHALAILRGWDATHVYAQVRDDGGAGRGFAERRGFVATDRVTRLSRLDSQKAGLDKSRAAAERVRDSGVRIVTLQELGDAALQDAWRVTNETGADVPSSETLEDLSYEHWRGVFLEGPGAGPELFWVALDGERVVGVAPLHIQGKRTAMNSFTGVLRSHRGRGIARALKFGQIEWARANGIDYLYTGNDMANAPMLAVNIDLGYTPLPATIEMVKRL